MSTPPAAFGYESGAQRVRFGWGIARAAVGEEATRLGAERVLVVAGESHRILAQDVAGDVPVAGAFREVRAHVPVALAERARARAAELDADLIVSVGGGSTTGLAKAVALTSGLPVLAVPTTYAGSEATPVWGLTEQQRKTTGTDARVLPHAVVYDPALTLGLPDAVTVTSGLNAIAHCVDAFWAGRANPVSSALAGEGIARMAAGLVAVHADGADRDGRGQCLIGAYLSGLAFAGAGSGLHHKICHVLGGAYDLPHAETHAVVLPHVLAFNAPAARGAAARIGAVLGGEPVASLVALGARLGAPTALRDLGLHEADLDEAAGLVAAAAPADNPRPVTREAAAALLRAAWAGDVPTAIPA